MLLSADNLCHYLVERNLLDRETILKGDFSVVSVPTRNNIFKVITRSGPRLFIKQVSTFDAHAVSILKREAMAYHFITKQQAYGQLASMMPAFMHYDPDRHVLVIAYFEHHISVHEYYFQQQQVFPSFAARQAEILASFHIPVRGDSDTSAFPKQLPWILDLQAHASNEFFKQGHSNTDLVGLIRSNPELSSMLGALKNEWIADSLIHGDIKWTNFITPSKADDARAVKLIDWELADIGDPCWDMAGLLQSFVSTWIFGFDNKDMNNHQLQEHMQPFDIERTRDVARHAWETYSHARNFTPAGEQAMLLKTVRFTAARLLQTSIEGVIQTPRVYPNNMRIIQTAFNILRSPETAAASLFGISTRAVA